MEFAENSSVPCHLEGEGDWLPVSDGDKEGQIQYTADIYDSDDSDSDTYIGLVVMPRKACLQQESILKESKEQNEALQAFAAASYPPADAPKSNIAEDNKPPSIDIQKTEAFLNEKEFKMLQAFAAASYSPVDISKGSRADIKEASSIDIQKTDKIYKKRENKMKENKKREIKTREKKMKGTKKKESMQVRKRGNEDKVQEDAEGDDVDAYVPFAMQLQKWHLPRVRNQKKRQLWREGMEAMYELFW